mgnify:FL=1
MNFVRGVDPKRAMKIGIITWDNLGPNNFLIQKKYPVPVYGREEKDFISKVLYFCCDGRKVESHIFDTYILIKDIKRLKLGIILIEFQLAGRDKTPTGGTYFLKGPLERFKKYFVLVQER